MNLKEQRIIYHRDIRFEGAILEQHGFTKWASKNEVCWKKERFGLNIAVRSSNDGTVNDGIISVNPQPNLALALFQERWLNDITGYMVIRELEYNPDFGTVSFHHYIWDSGKWYYRNLKEFDIVHKFVVYEHARLVYLHFVHDFQTVRDTWYES